MQCPVATRTRARIPIVLPFSISGRRYPANPGLLREAPMMALAVAVPRQLGRALRIATSALPTLAIFAYFSGWQYVNEYFSTFGINRSSFAFSDYTVFVYMFSVVAKFPEMILSFSGEFLLGIAAILATLAGPVAAPRLPRVWPRMLLLRLWVWIGLALAVFFVSQLAGRLDAQSVLDGHARTVNLFFTPDFEKHLAANLGKNGATQRVQEIRKASEKGALALIWRSANETILLLYGTSGQFHGCPLEILRMRDSYILGVFASVKPTDSKLTKTSCSKKNGATP